MSNEIKYSKEVSDFIEANSSVVNDHYFMPHWYKKVGEGLFQIVAFDKLPKEVINFIKENREK